MKKGLLRFAVVFGVASVLSTRTPALAQQPPLTETDFQLVGPRLAISPPVLTVPKDVPTFINATLAVSVSATAATDDAIAQLSQGAAVLAELRGPSIAPTVITALPGQPLHLPPFHLEGDYVLDNIRLVKGGATILAAEPSAVPIKVIGEILITSVTTRPLTLEEIQQAGIVIDATDFHALNFQAAFVIDGRPVKIDFPVILPNPPPVNIPGRAPPKTFGFLRRCPKT